MDTGAQPAFSFILRWDPSRGMASPVVRVGLLPQPHLEIPFQTCLEVCLLRDSKTHQVDN